MVVRIAPVFLYKPDEVWQFPFGYYLTLRNMYVRMFSKSSSSTADRKSGDIGPTLTSERLDQLAEEGVTDIDFDDFIAKSRRK